MKILDVFRINIKKLKKRTGKSLFLIIPISVLVCLSIVISSQSMNFRTAMDESIFGEIEEEGTLIELTYQADTSEMGFRFTQEENVFTEADLKAVQDIDNVSEALLEYTLPISRANTEDLFEDTEISLRELGVLSEEMATMYTSEDFSYDDNSPIPIVLNSSNFMESYEDWEGQDEITVNMREMMQQRIDSGEEVTMEPGSGPDQFSPVKSSVIDYDKDNLIGKEITITFGGFSDISDVNVERSEGIVTFTKKSEEDMAEEESTRADAVNQYWDYDKLSEGLSYTFIVVGIIESETSRTSYIPEEFADVLMHDYIQLQLDSRNGTEISTDELQSEFTGLSYDGTELTSGSFFGGPGGGMRPPDGGGGPMGFTSSDEASTTYDIPGLVIEVSESDSSDVVGLYEDADVFGDSVKTGQVINIKIDSVSDRTQVVNDINKLGYAYQDVNDLGVFSQVQSTLDKLSAGLVIGFIALTSATIILTMSKFVSDSTKEIGILRAIGFKKGNILSIFLSQSVLYTLLGYLIGVGLGLLLNLAVSPLISNWFDNLITQTVKETFNVVNPVDVSIFNGVDLSSLLIFSGVLFVITILVSLVPATTASNVSPVEAIKAN